MLHRKADEYCNAEIPQEAATAHDTAEIRQLKRNDTTGTRSLEWHKILSSIFCKIFTPRQRKS